MELTEYEQGVIDQFKFYEEEAHVAMRKAETMRMAMLKVLGHKADCAWCGNRHWPVCGEEIDGTKS